MRNWKWPSLSGPAVGLVVILLLIALIFNSHLEQWLMRLSMAALFCTVIYLRDNANADRWIAIAIIAAGTLLSLVLFK